MIMYKEWNEISYAHAHEWMDDACAHEMQVSNAMLNTGVLHGIEFLHGSAPLIKVVVYLMWNKLYLRVMS